jgi:hypothetical protein
VWTEYAAATRSGRLGIAAEVSTQPDPRFPVHVIIVYTRDYNDVDDVRRVLRALRTKHGVQQNLGYKTGEATLSGHYGEGVSLYTSRAGSLDMRRRTH